MAYTVDKKIQELDVGSTFNAADEIPVYDSGATNNPVSKTTAQLASYILASSAFGVEDVFVPTNGQTVFTLSQTPISGANFQLFLNGQLRLRGTDYTQSGTTLTWLNPGSLTLVTTDELIADYNKISSGSTIEHSFVFQPSGTASGNTYITWASLVAALPATSDPKYVYLDKTFAAITIPAGAWNMQNSFICGLDQKEGSGTTAVSVAVGTTFTNLLGFNNNLVVTFNNTAAAAISLATAATCSTFLTGNNVSIRNNGSKAVFALDTSAAGQFRFLFKDATWINLTYEVYESTGTTGIPFFLLYDLNTISQNTLRDVSGSAKAIRILFINPSSSYDTTQANLNVPAIVTYNSRWDLLTWGLTDMSIPYMSGGLGYLTEVTSSDFIWNYSATQLQIGLGTAGGSPSVAGQGQQYVMSGGTAGYNAEVASGPVIQLMCDGSTGWTGTWSSNDFTINTNQTPRITCGATGYNGVSSLGAFAPSQTWENTGSEAQATVTYNAGGSISGLERNVIANFSSPDTFILPAVAGNVGRVIDFINKTANALTLQGNGAENINGANTYIVGAQYKAATVVSDGVEWFVKAKV